MTRPHTITLTRQQVRRIDELAVQRYRIPGIVLMENAAIGVARVARSILDGMGLRTASILCGGGNNGGDGLALARHLHNSGYEPLIGLCSDPGKYQGDALANWRIVEAMKLPTFAATADTLARQARTLIVDAIFGTGLTSEPRPPFADLCQAVRQSGCVVLAVDLPSGLDCDTGLPLGECISAHFTVTLVAMKAGFANPGSRQFTGSVSVADIGAPPELIDQVLVDEV